MCGRYYVDDEISREIEKIVKKLDQRLKIEHGQDIHPSGKSKGGRKLWLDQRPFRKISFCCWF